MSDYLPDLFIQPIPITGIGRLLMLIPLALSISIVYKTIRCDRLSAVPVASLSLCFMIVAGMMLIGFFLMILFLLFA
ncbi:MAG: hypothetical protein ACE5EC_03180 [Phycisphaerae bacterium]